MHSILTCDACLQVEPGALPAPMAEAPVPAPMPADPVAATHKDYDL